MKLEAIFVFKNIFNDIFEHNDDIGYQSYENHIKKNIKSRKKHFKKLKKLKSYFLRRQQKYILFKQNNYLWTK